MSRFTAMLDLGGTGGTTMHDEALERWVGYAISLRLKEVDVIRLRGWLHRAGPGSKESTE